MKYTFRQLMELLEEYNNNPHNHESCSFGRPNGPDGTTKECDCYQYDLIQQFLLWVRDKNIGTL